MTDSKILFKCSPCGYETTIKYNLARHCECAKHRATLGLEKNPTKKELAAAAEAAEVLAAQVAEQLAAQVAEQLAAQVAERVAEVEATRTATQEFVRTQFIFEAEMMREIARVREEEQAKAAAVAAELAKTPAQRKREREIAAGLVKAADKKTEHAEWMAYRVNRDANVAAAKVVAAALSAQNKKEAAAQKLVALVQVKAEHKLEMGAGRLDRKDVKFEAYIDLVCREETVDAGKLTGFTLSNYLESSTRSFHRSSPIYGYLQPEYIQYMRGLADKVYDSITSSAVGNVALLLAPAEHAVTERGKKQIMRPSQFHPSFQSKPWVPLKENLNEITCTWRGADIQCLFSKVTLKVYDLEATQEIGVLDSDRVCSFHGGKPPDDVIQAQQLLDDENDRMMREQMMKAAEPTHLPTPKPTEETEQPTEQIPPMEELIFFEDDAGKYCLQCWRDDKTAKVYDMSLTYHMGTYVPEDGDNHARVAYLPGMPNEFILSD